MYGFGCRYFPRLSLNRKARTQENRPKSHVLCYHQNQIASKSHIDRWQPQITAQRCRKLMRIRLAPFEMGTRCMLCQTLGGKTLGKNYGFSPDQKLTREASSAFRMQLLRASFFFVLSISTADMVINWNFNRQLFLEPSIDMNSFATSKSDIFLHRIDLGSFGLPNLWQNREN